jgi:peptidyl-prolyl cis-trans isomerase SurA
MLPVTPGGVPPPAPAQTVVDRVVAVVNDEAIMMSELLERTLRAMRDRGRQEAASSDRDEFQRRLLDQLVNERLQIQEARREGVQVSTEEVDKDIAEFVRQNGGDRARLEEQLRAEGWSWEGLRRELREQLLAKKIRSRRISPRVSVTEAEVDAYVRDNRGKLEEGLKYRPRHIALLARPADDAQAWVEARRRIDELVARLREGADFGALAQAHSDDASAKAQGDLGWLARGELQPLFEEPILRLERGGVTAPIKSDVGYHLFRLEDRQELTPEAQSQFRQQARDLLFQRKALELLEVWIEELRRRALIVVRL